MAHRPYVAHKTHVKHQSSTNTVISLSSQTCQSGLWPTPSFSCSSRTQVVNTSTGYPLFSPGADFRGRNEGMNWAVVTFNPGFWSHAKVMALTRACTDDWWAQRTYCICKAPEMPFYKALNPFLFLKVYPTCKKRLITTPLYTILYTVFPRSFVILSPEVSSLWAAEVPDSNGQIQVATKTPLPRCCNT